MNIKVILIGLAIGVAGVAAAAPNVFGTINIKKTPQQEIDELLEKRREMLKTDSLLNTVHIDSLTRAVYIQFPLQYTSPLIIGPLEENQFITINTERPSYQSLAGVAFQANDSTVQTIHPASLPADIADPIPEWFKTTLRMRNQLHDARLRMMIANPYTIQYTDWELPIPPRLPNEDHSYHAYLKTLNLPEPSPEDVVIPTVEIKKKHWLHYFNVGLQFSQAYVSNNWYQGGNSYLAGLFNFTWNVDLNTVYHPKLLFQSSLQYKLAVNSNPKGSLHKYNTSQDLFQYSIKGGLKAFNHWFYSVNGLFQTQLFNAYPADSEVRSSTLLSPGTFNLGVGMTYTLVKKGANFSISISPLAYNLKTCIASDINHEQFGIKPNRKTVSEIGSSAEANLTWNISDKFSWKSRVFLFTDYDYFLFDWENTLNFQFNKVLSTQIFLHPRFDSSTDRMASKWRYWMFHEILSFGISYTFQTPK